MPASSPGRYRLDAMIGEGGMGRVYRGFDAALERVVAIKLLPSALVSDPARVSRFIQEARAASALNHPHVVTIFDIGEDRFDGESESCRFIAMELIDGRTLRDLIGSPQFDLRRGLKIASQVAEALGAAHAAGIIHRDLKPENIMVNGAGMAKVLDFGLAKLRLDDGVGNDDSRTIERPSDPGTILGTVGYMSPEQAQGQSVDARSDLFSLGCVLYEIATTQRAFRGDSSVDTLHKIIYSEPVPLRDLRADLPPEFARIVRKALAKDPDERYQSAKDIAIDLRDLLREIDSNPSGLSTLSLVTATAAVKPSKWIVPTLVAVLLLTIAALLFTLVKPLRNAPSGLKAESIKIERITANGKVIQAVISPDAKFAAYATSDQGQQTLVVRDMASGQTLTLIPARRTSYWGMTFTPDSSTIYFGAKDILTPAGAIYQISTLGGQPRKLVEGTDSQPTFSPDGKQMAFLRAGFPTRAESAVMIARSDGSGIRVLKAVQAPDFFVPIFFAGASWSPDGKMIATAVITVEKSAARLPLPAQQPRPRGARIVTIDVADGSMKAIVEHIFPFIAQVAWLPDQKGLIAIAQSPTTRNDQVWYVPYPSGEPQPITRDLFAYRIASLSADGKSLVTVASDVTADLWVARDGAAPHRIDASKAEGINGVSSLPDGRLVTSSLETGKLDLFLMNQDGSGRIQITHDENGNRSPVVTHDGKRVVYLSTTPRGHEICRINIDGSDRIVLARTSEPTAFITISPDDRTVVYDDLVAGAPEEKRAGLSGGLSRVSIDGGPSSLLTRDIVGVPSFSPDGSRIAGLLLDDSGRYFLATIPAAGGPPTRITEWAASAFSMPRWTADGKALVVNTVTGDRTNLWMIPLDGSPQKKLTNFEERLLFCFAPLGDGKGWVVSRGDLSRDAMLITGFRPPR